MMLARRGYAAVALCGVLALPAGCADRDAPGGGPPPAGVHVPCADRNALRNLYFGDLHVHTAYSFDAHVFDVRATPADAYRFARGEPLELPPLDADGRGTQALRLDRPLDFAAVTDHSEYLGEVEACLTPGARGYDGASCTAFRAGGNVGQAVFGAETTQPEPTRDASVCGADGNECLVRASEVWRRTIEAANAAYDPTERCAFTSFVAYEYTANTGASSQHRNVIFASDRVPPPTTYVEQPTAEGLWAELRATCLDAGTGCDALAIPHNPNQSNGKLLRVEYPPGATPDERRRHAEERAAIEPLVEIFQHKGDSECALGLSGVVGAADELCGFEKLRTPPFEDCGDGVGAGGTANSGCVSRRDYVRGALLDGIREDEQVGANPLRLGIVASTDTHNGTPGAVAEQDFLGHRGSVDDLPDERLSAGFRAGTVFNPGGLTAVWAEENTREALFAALRRREVYGTSGPRIAVRFFAGALDDGACDDVALLERAYERGVPMGGVLDGDAAGVADGGPAFLVTALRDAGTAERPGTRLQRVQIVKGWIQDGVAHERVYDVAGDAAAGTSVDTATCALPADGFDALCAVWRDPEFDPEQHAFWYARVLETASCRWTAYACNALAPSERPEACSDPEVPKTIQERAWTSPVWYRPARH